MATNFPTSLDSFVNPTGTDNLNSGTVPHASQHDNLNDAVLALQTKVGINGANFPTGLVISGQLQTYGSANRFGKGADGVTTLPNVLIGDLGDTSSVYVVAEGPSVTNVALVLRPKGGGSILFQDGNGNARFVVGSGAPTSGTTCMQAVYHNGTAVTTQVVSVGAADSGGAGYKLLRVPN